MPLCPTFGDEADVRIEAARVMAQEIKDHHAGRLQKLRDTSTELERPASVMEMSTHLFSPRAQGGMADSETFAHLEHLRLLGEADVRSVDGVLEFAIH